MSLVAPVLPPALVSRMEFAVAAPPSPVVPEAVPPPLPPVATVSYSGKFQLPPFSGEDRQMIPSPRDVATYDAKPEMSASAVADAVVGAVERDQYDRSPTALDEPCGDDARHQGVSIRTT